MCDSFTTFKIFPVNLFCLQCYLKEVENDKETLMASNNSLAEFNLAKEPELVEGRERLEERSKEGEELSKRVKELSEELSKFFLSDLYCCGVKLFLYVL